MKVHTNRKTKDYVFTSETSPEIIPQGKRIFIKGNKHHQIEDVNPREVGGINLFTKYYHRDARIYVDQYVAEVVKLWRKEA